MKALYTKPIGEESKVADLLNSLGYNVTSSTTYADVFDFLYNKGVYVTIIALPITQNMYSFQTRMIGCPQWTGCGTTWEMCAKDAIEYIVNYLKA